MKWKFGAVLLSLCLVYQFVYFKSKLEKQKNEMRYRYNQIILTKLNDLDRYKFRLFAYDKRFKHFSRILTEIESASVQYGLSPYLILSIIQVESNFDQYQTSKAGAYGLMQVRYNTWAKVYSIPSPNSLYKIRYNIGIGCQILKHYIKMNNYNVEKGLYMYNNGFKGTNDKYYGKIRGAYGQR